ncbi:uncharacterized protein LOC126262597 isoform X2 [Schistocerca nitens]|uniref:uncharacterized protein LOC126262597 isoform X2 n=1 Tax=Schistocerca nitens TaxID=7011 RepID=UPI0021189A3C|nr:uncharacterized protein LOC126262597 isoform X2 [Schistocerca nitens]
MGARRSSSLCSESRLQYCFGSSRGRTQHAGGRPPLRLQRHVAVGVARSVLPAACGRRLSHQMLGKRFVPRQLPVLPQSTLLSAVSEMPATEY